MEIKVINVNIVTKGLIPGINLKYIREHTQAKCLMHVINVLRPLQPQLI